MIEASKSNFFLGGAQRHKGMESYIEQMGDW